MTRAIAITCQGVSKAFPLVDQGSAWKLVFGGRADVKAFEALREVSFVVPKGEFVGVLGRNGAGKSTLLRTIGGVYAADRGWVSVNGALSGLYELGLVGNPQLTGREYADRLLTVHSFDSRRRRAMLEDIQDFSELGERFDDPVLTYSAGMTARLFFATATAGHYDVYLLDEILSVGDQHFQAKCWRRLRDRVSGGASGILVTHDWGAIIKMCQTAFILEKGAVTFGGPAEHAARVYLYGEAAREPRQSGVARFLRRPDDPIIVNSGEDLRLTIEAEVLCSAQVGAVAVVERLEPGYGWETMLMSRKVAPVGDAPGRYEVTLEIPSVPLEAGSYHLNLHLVMPDPEIAGRRIALDGFSWLNGDGLALTVECGRASRGMTLPALWHVEAA